MLKFFYQWRYQRSQRAGAFQLPRKTHGHDLLRTNFGNYLSQASVRGRHFERFDLPRKRRRRVGLILILIALCVLGWLVYESITALEIFRH